jgi:uncharacterized membrane protein YgcG
MADNKFIPPKNFTDNPKLSLVGDLWDPNIKGKRPNMKLRVVNGNIRITVYPNHPDDGDNTPPVNANMDPVIGNIFMRMLLEAASNPDFTVEGIKNKNYDWSGGVKSEKLEVMSEVYVGRDAEGVVSIMVECKNAPRCVFRMMPNFFYALVDKNGNPLDPAVTSRRVVEGYVDAMREVLGPVLIDTHEKKEAQDAKKREGGQGGGRGNYGGGNRGGNGGGYNKSSGNGGGGYKKTGYEGNGRSTDVFADV